MKKTITLGNRTFEAELVIPPPIEEFLRQREMSPNMIESQEWDIDLHDALLDPKYSSLPDNKKLLVVVNGFFISDTDHIYINPRDVTPENPIATLTNRSGMARQASQYSIYYVVYEKKRKR